MNSRGVAQKTNTFRLIYTEIIRARSVAEARSFLNASSLSVLVLAVLSTVSTVEMAIRTDMLWASFITLGVQTIAVAFFFIEPKLDGITTRLLLLSYLFFYVMILFFGQGESAFPLYWTYSFALFAFVGAGGAESFVWIAFQFVILLGGVLRHKEALYQNGDSYTIRLFIYTYLLVVGLGFVLEHAAKLALQRANAQTKELEKSNARYNVMLDSVGDGLIAVDEHGLVEFVNSQALQLLGYSKEELVGQPLTAVVMAKDQRGEIIPHANRPITKVLRSGKSIVINQASKERHFFIRKDRSEFVTALVCSPVTISGEVRGALQLFHDMSIEEQLDRSKSEFVSLASHQLRTPLNVISWYVEKLLSKKKGDLNIAQSGYLNEVRVNTERMIRLVADLLNVTRVELGRVKLKYEVVDLTTLIPELIKEIAPLLEQKKLTFSSNVVLPNGGTFTNSDQSVVTVIIQNLLSNAVKYTPDFGSITMTASETFSGAIPNEAKEIVEAHSSGVFISVRDSGIGIPASQQEKIFSKLFRADNVTNLDVSGTGLGLYVTQSFAEALGGTIWFESEESKGSTFSVFIPYIGPKADLKENA